MKRLDVATCTVTATEARSNTTGPLLRQAVMIEHENAFHYGQVLETTGHELTVQLLEESVITISDTVTQVAPIVALLFQAPLSFKTTDWTVDEMVETHHTILDRICGTGNAEGSNDILVILANLIAVVSYPDPVRDVSWIDPKTR
ncbi:hypothetical protein PHMEG_00035492 [Phytophthora megakarya]|uniref:Uncharacterized protein n=1 Tax=Phytophthora megakarya TaxID=4795 RepID=A0A225UNN9_9STRA|nr:hypothetical protein PHMEG_00035492 [Phytophthora megakarya]